MEIIYVILDKVEYEVVKDLEHLLPPERREKIHRLRIDSDKLLSLTVGLLIRRAIGDSSIRLNDSGKPYAVDSDIYFSVSHSGRCAAIAVDSAEVGLDVQKLPDKEYLKIAERFYHPSEFAYVTGSDDSALAFTRIWTRKEAYLKQLGIGISTDLRSFDTTSPELSERIRSFDIDGYMISVCADKRIEEESIYISCLELKDVTE